jgi:hypothetical protein
MRPVLFVLIVLAFSSCSQQRNIIKEDKSYKGIIHRTIINDSDTLLINVIEIDMSTNLYELLAVKGGDSLTGRETMSSMVKRLSVNFDVAAGINTDFFMMGKGGEPINNMVSDGIVVKGLIGTDTDSYQLKNTHAQFAVTDDNRFYIERFNLDSKLFFKGDSITVNRVNSVTDSGGVTIYNSYQGFIDEGIPLRLVSRNIDTLFLVYDNTGSADIEYSLSWSSSPIESLLKTITVEDTLVITLSFTPDYGRIKNSAGGWGKIVDRGKNTTPDTEKSEGIMSSFSLTKHPRSGIGFSADSTKIYFITVDGRQEKSRGVSLDEFAEIMINEGIYSGLNLDGGGSTTLVYNGRVVNNPSDKTGERLVGSGIVVIRKKEGQHE